MGLCQALLTLKHQGAKIPGQLANTLWQEHGELIVLADDSALLAQGPAEKIIAELHLPVLLVRPRGE